MDADWLDLAALARLNHSLGEFALLSYQANLCALVNSLTSGVGHKLKQGDLTR